ncbi:MAG: hypothetical protein WC455_24315 [Dehalococcoidia bacterium]|jgi:hypothetical protein
MSSKISDFTVFVDIVGTTQSIKGPNGMSIPPDPGNSRYQDFLEVDTDQHLCTRVTIPEPVISTTPTQEERIAAIEDALIALTGV